MMYSLKRIIALAVAAVSASTLIAAQATAAFASEESDYEEMLRQKQLEAEAFLSEQTDIPEEQPEINYEDLDPEFAKIATLFGDVNFDRLVGIADAVQLQRYLLGQTEDLGNWFNADLNEDGVINVHDFTLLKQQICGFGQQKGGSAAIKVIDVMTGEPIDGGYISMFCIYDNTWAYDIARWKNKAEETAFFSGLPNDDPKYVYYLNIDNLPIGCGYGNMFGSVSQQYSFSFKEGETNKAVNLRLVSNEDEKHPNVVINQMDWAMGENILDYGCNYGWTTILDQDGNMFFQRVDSKGCTLPDGEYRAVFHPYSDIEDGYPMHLINPDSDFAKHVMELYPDVEFTDKSEGIDFTVKDGKADKEITFDFGPSDGVSNSIEISCYDAMTGEPLEGVEFSLIEGPDTYAKKVGSWISDETGTHTFTGILKTGMVPTNRAYQIHVESIPAGYETCEDKYILCNCITGHTDACRFDFFASNAPKQISADVINYADGSVMNGDATFEIYRLNSDNIADTTKLHNNVKVGEPFALGDGSYVACLNVFTLPETGFKGINLFDNADVAAALNPDEFVGNTSYIRFTVTNGMPDRELKFYVRSDDAA